MAAFRNRAKSLLEAEPHSSNGTSQNHLGWWLNDGYGPGSPRLKGVKTTSGMAKPFRFRPANFCTLWAPSN
jgi:hypothetical protein